MPKLRWPKGHIVEQCPKASGQVSQFVTTSHSSMSWLDSAGGFTPGLSCNLESLEGSTKLDIKMVIYLRWLHIQGWHFVIVTGWTMLWESQSTYCLGSKKDCYKSKHSKLAHRGGREGSAAQNSQWVHHHLILPVRVLAEPTPIQGNREATFLFDQEVAGPAAEKCVGYCCIFWKYNPCQIYSENSFSCCPMWNFKFGSGNLGYRERFGKGKITLVVSPEYTCTIIYKHWDFLYILDTSSIMQY